MSKLGLGIIRFWVFGIFFTAGLFIIAAGAGEGMAMVKNKELKTQKAKPVCGLPQSEEELKKMLTPEQYRIMRENGTEAPFKNEYWNNKRQGIYVDAITGEPLFSSTDKFDSGTGWPSFTQPINKQNIIEKPDNSHGMLRTEVRSLSSNSHLGHLFNDGPKPSGLRFCLNSASLRFIPVEKMKEQGYERYLNLFNKTQTATFGAGCFWGVEAAFREVKGIVNTEVGFMGGTTKNPTYKEVCANKTGHAEVVRVEYDPKQVSYDKLLEVFWNIHNPATAGRQGADIGSQYRSVIFYNNAQEQEEALKLKAKLEKEKKFSAAVTTEIVPAQEFYKAEEYHQRYYEKHGMKPVCQIPQK